MDWLADVDAVFFDAVGTLIHPEPSAALAYAEAGRRHGSALTADAVRQRFAAAFAGEEAADLAGGLRTSEERELRRWRAIVAAVLDDVRDAEACFADLYAHFARPAAWRVEAQAAEVLRALAARGLTVGVASNFDRRLRGVADGLPALADVRHFFISSEVGWRKPAPQFFAALAAGAGVPAGRILLVGDDRDNDYLGAQAAGLRAVLFDPRGRGPADVPSVGRLAELFN
jgi:putative hydrolase of the HAD superfamily